MQRPRGVLEANSAAEYGEARQGQFLCNASIGVILLAFAAG